MHHEGAHEDRAAEHDEREEHDLLEGVQLAQVDGVEAGQRDGGDGEEEGVGEADAAEGRAGAPEDEGGEQTRRDEVQPVRGDEVERREAAAQGADRAGERAP